MKALTLKHPWPWAICHLGKDIENRTWKPPASLIGRYFAIHGGAVPRGRAFQEMSDIGWALADDRDMIPGVTVQDTIMPGIVAVVLLTGVVTASPSPWFEGPYGWCLGDLFVLPEPVACKGAQGLWDVPEGHVEEIRRQWREAKSRSLPA